VAKKYYWLKLHEGFFRDKKIKKLRKIAGGDTYTVIYLKMQLLSLKNDGKLYFDSVEDGFAEELALELDEEVENVKVTLAFLFSNGLIEEVEEDSFILPETVKSIGGESSSAPRVRKHRAKKKELLPQPENQKMLHCNATVTNGNTELEKELEKEKEIELEKELTDREKERVDLLRDLFASWQIDDNKIFYLSSLVNKRIPYVPGSFHDRDLKIYEFLDTLIKKAKAENVKYIYAWMQKLIPVFEWEGLDYEEELPY